MIAIIGNPDSGKSTFIRKLAKLGYTTFESDAWFDSQYVKGTPIFDALINRFGTTISKDNKINKSTLKSLISADFSVLHELELLVHPYLFEHLSQHEYDFVEIPILKWSPIDFTNLFLKVLNVVDFDNENVDNFHQKLIDTKKRAFRRINSVDIYVKSLQNKHDIYNLLSELQIPNL